ncbi:hypothetical protein [Aurantimonas sp. A3-2-R12]|uniref:hypothetical protein n=1 Tax=Aurantimonas sp. A3-2-R12 TaxID=3114362 RepID=UPI002E19A46D|nr:hypothetical protein [Aurantimonas sp. A3-2-R12]
MPDSKSRARVNRLLGGDFRPDDLTGLFLYARDHCDGREAVADIGHFVAHHHERDRGITTRSTREWFAVARYHLSRFGSGGPHKLDGNRLPSAARDYFEIAINRVEAKFIQRETGLKRAKAYDVMRGIIPRMVQNHDMTWQLPITLTGDELKLVNCVSSLMVVKPAFEEGRLVDDFVATLKSNGLISKEEIRNHKTALAALIPLYAISAMHNCVVQLGDGTTTQLKGAATGGEISVSASIPVKLADGRAINAACAIFSSSLDPTLHCAPELLSGKWDFEIELRPDRRLARLV